MHQMDEFHIGRREAIRTPMEPITLSTLYKNEAIHAEKKAAPELRSRFFCEFEAC